MATGARRTDQTRALWRLRLGSALRTILACVIVDCTTQYAPAAVRRLLAFPAFSYLTTILIVSDATLGDTLRGCWHTIFATIQIMIPSILSLWLIGPARFTTGVAALAVAINAFVVAIPESTHLMTKRIAFGQLVIVYVGTVINGAQTGALMHPVHVASSTALGVFASVLAMLFPYPKLAYYEVRKACRLYAENVSERLNYFVNAFSAQDNQAARDLDSRAKPLSKAGAKLLQSIKYNLEGMLWERPQIKFSKPNCIDQVEKLQDMELPMRGMEIALTGFTSFNVRMINEELRQVLESLKVQIGQNFVLSRCCVSSDATTSLPTWGELLDKSLWNLKNISITQEDMPVFFFLYCAELLDKSPTRTPEFALENTQNRDTEESSDSQNQAERSFKRTWRSLNIIPNSQSLVFAFKCSISLGLAVLFGLLYNEENGYWSGLTIAISFATGRQATFTMANARAQGTAMGSVYGILGCYIFQRYVDLRFLPLLPWIIFTTFLRHSRMYGQAGGISAVIGALLILGRKSYGSPSEFAIARITEACIGLICFVILEVFVHPARAPTLAKTELSKSLGALQDWIKGIVFCASQNNMPASTLLALREKEKRMKTHVNKLEKFIAESELEPNFWFLPFHGSCYGKLLGSLSKMVNLLLFVAYKMEFLSQASQRFGVDLKELQECMNNDLKLFKEKVGSSLKCLEKVTSIKSLAVLEKELQKKIVSHDIELGKSPNANAFRLLSTDEEEVETIVSSFIQHLKEEAAKIYTNECEEKLKTQIVFCLSGLGFCINSLIRETMVIEEEVQELVRWENPSSHITLSEISCKINALHT